MTIASVGIYEFITTIYTLSQGSKDKLRRSGFILVFVYLYYAASAFTATTAGISLQVYAFIGCILGIVGILVRSSASKKPTVSVSSTRDA